MSANMLKYRSAFDLSQTLLDVIGVNKFPLDFDSLFAKKKGAPILVSTLDQYNSWMYSMHPSQWAPLFILDAKCFYYPDRDAYMIVYNEARPETRIRFSLAHELAHIVLGHLSDERTEVSRGGVDDPIYCVMEGAANVFAGNFLAPPILIDSWLSSSPFNIKSIAQRFNISLGSVRDYRVEDYNYWKTRLPSKRKKSILERCYSNLHHRQCAVCGAAFSIQGARFCPICGDGLPGLYQHREVGVEMVYPGVELNEHGQAKLCPICKNEEYLEMAIYCMVCGKPAINQCCFATMDPDYAERYPEQCKHQEPLPGNARYCPFCGKKTTFFEGGMLDSWDTPNSNDDDWPF